MNNRTKTYHGTLGLTGNSQAQYVAIPYRKEANRNIVPGPNNAPSFVKWKINRIATGPDADARHLTE